MTNQDEIFDRNLDGYITKFKNGEERFNTSPTVNRVIQSLVRGADPIEIIDQLCQICDDVQKAHIEFALNDTRPLIVNIDKQFTDGISYQEHIEKANEVYDEIVKPQVITELKQKNKELVEALKEIVSPITYMRNRLEEGEVLDAYMAMQMSDSANYLKRIAEKALEQNDL